MSGFIGKKLGMISLYDKNNNLNSITLIYIYNCFILNFDIYLKYIFISYSKDNYNFNFNNFNFNNFYIGDLFSINYFYINKKLNIKGITIGKGFSGTIKRYNFKINNLSHGNSKAHRKPGSIGMCQDPGRVLLGKKLPGHLGNNIITIKNLKLIKIDYLNQIFYIKGCIPGKINYVYIY